MIFMKLFFLRFFVILVLDLSAEYRACGLVDWGTLELACEEDLNIFNSSPVMGDMKPESETVEVVIPPSSGLHDKSADMLCIYAV